MSNIQCLILAAGSGQRLHSPEPKAFLHLQGQTLLEHSIRTLNSAPAITTITLVVPPNKLPAAQKIAQNFPRVKFVISGGPTRFASLLQGYTQIAPNLQPTDLVLIHNAANPNCTPAEIHQTCQAAQKFGAATVGYPLTATLKKVQAQQIQQTLDRQQIWATETPQVLQAQVLTRGLQLAQKQKILPTDDVTLAELTGLKPRLILANPLNRKITYQQDLLHLKNFSPKKTTPQPTLPSINFQNFLDTLQNFGQRKTPPANFRLGLGQDSHCFTTKPKTLILAGVPIPNAPGLQGNSDGDVVLHALTNALSSALGQFSLSNFADPLCQQGLTDSAKFLAVILRQMQAQKFTIQNLALTLEGQKPRLEKHLPRMQKKLAKLLNLAPKLIGLTVTSGENLTPFGRGQGLQVLAFVLLKKYTEY